MYALTADEYIRLQFVLADTKSLGAVLMAKRDNHYEAAFEAYLRQRGVAYVAVDEAKRSTMGYASLKNVDFILSGNDGRNWLVDVKGRRFPAGGQSKQYWRNWSTQDDVDSLAQWERAFGERFASLLVFAYDVVGDRAPLPQDQLFEFRGHLYGFVAIRLHEYVHFARTISPKWGTLAVPVPTFRQLAASLDHFLECGVDSTEPQDAIATA